VTKMKTFWEWLAREIDRNSRKDTHQSTTLAKYNIAARSGS